MNFSVYRYHVKVGSKKDLNDFDLLIHQKFKLKASLMRFLAVGVPRFYLNSVEIV